MKQIASRRVVSSLAASTLFLVLAGAAWSATEQQPAGRSPGVLPLPSVDGLTTPPIDLPALLAEDEEREAAGLPPRFARPFAFKLGTSDVGTWETLPDGNLMWRLVITAPAAKNLNLGFTRYRMPEGGRLMIYTPDYLQIMRAFTAADNDDHGQLWTGILHGDQIVVELTLPPKVLGKLDLQLGSVNHGYKMFGTSDKSGACNVDVVCPEGVPWSDQIRSVAVISTGGSTFCTGGLLNNAAQDNKGYFLTAAHCDINSGNAATLVTFWNFQNSTCRPPGGGSSGGPGNGTLTQFNTGSIFRAARSQSDFTLVELDDPIDPTFNVYWAGWDRSAGDSASAVAIHHPQTDEKRISFENDPTATSSYLGTTSPGDGTHVRVVDWDLGTTEPGSSGSPLFNQDKRVVGQLHGGGAACGNNDSDYYGRLSVSWDTGATPATRLRDWLDPGNTGVLFLDGKDSSPSFSLTAGSPSSLEVCKPDDAVYTINVVPSTGYASPVTLSVTNPPGGATVTFSPNPVTPPGQTSSTLTVGTAGIGSPGDYPMTVEGNGDPNLTRSTSLTLRLATASPGLATLTSPANDAVDVGTSPVLAWSAATQGTSYDVEIAEDSGFTNVVRSGTALPGTTFAPSPALDPSTDYYWRVKARNGCGQGNFSAPFHFLTANIICQAPGLGIPDANPSGITSTLSVGTAATLGDLNVSVDIPHTWVGDLIVTLRHVETNTSVILIDRPGRTTTGNGCSENDIDATLDDAAAIPVETQCSASPPAAIFGTFSPNNALAAFNGQNLAGTWTLNVADVVGEDTGTLAGWCLVPSSSGPPPATSTRTPTRTATVTPTQPTATSTPTSPGPPATGTPTATQTPPDASTPASSATPSPSQTATPVVPPQATPTSTPSLGLTMDHDNAPVGTLIRASGALPPGTYCLCMVPNGVYPVGSDYLDDPLATTEVTVSGASVPPIAVWRADAPGSYDLLALRGRCGTARTVETGDDLGGAPGLVVDSSSSVPLRVSLLLALLPCAAALFLRRRRRSA